MPRVFSNLARFAPRGHGYPPGKRKEDVVPETLSDTEIARALGGLAGWRGDARHLSRTVRVPEQAHGALIGRVQRDAAELSDHAQFERRRGELTFTVTTGFPGRVTEPDLWLASRIEAVLAELT
ncbi:4a-hydroxytetrahydrobiopterin dehydratase [Amycolatopsis thermoflava]|uniref:4a-hydroxytetrahydrobiopterin dehydratase n=1 Tax=Amycolatopsis thermoflava TaxID=84480 RepID=UPI0036598808